MKYSLKLTPEWVLEKLPHSHYCDEKGKSSVYTGNATDAAWIELALNSLNIEFETYDYIDGNGEMFFGFDFQIENMENYCQILMKTKKMNNYRKIYKRSLKRKSYEKI